MIFLMGIAYFVTPLVSGLFAAGLIRTFDASTAAAKTANTVPLESNYAGSDNYEI